MNRSLPVVALASLLALPSAVSAQTARSVSFGASGGLSLPLGDLGKDAEAGFSVAGHLYFKPATMNKLGFRGDVSFDRWSVKGSGSASGASASLSSMGFTGNILGHLADDRASIRPYVIAGGGMYRTKASVSNAGVGVSATSTDPGIQGGAGLEFKLSGFSTFLESKFVNVFGDGASSTFVPITFGVRF